MNCAVIGSSKIAEVHINEFIKNNISVICLISRHKHKRLSIINKLIKKFKNVKFYEAKIDILKKKLTYFIMKLNFNLIFPKK